MTNVHHYFNAVAFTLIALLVIPSFCSLQFKPNGEFTILQFTDFHYCEEYLKDLNTQKLAKKLIDIVQPDFVMVSGDGVSGYAEAAQLPGFYEVCWKKFTAPIIEANITYGFTVGNHDLECDLTNEEIIRLDSSSKFSIRSQCDGIPDKATFRIPIFSSRNASMAPAHVWVFDSGNTGCHGYENSWGCITDDQLSWYDQESLKVKEKYGKNLQHIAFYHIPSPEYRTVYNDIPIYGVSDDTVGCPVYNTKFFEHVLKNGDITATFVGHDHNNNFGGWLQGIELVYGQKSGYGGYGEVRGARVIKFKENWNQEGQLIVTRNHYVVYENGTILPPEPRKRREGPPQASCATPNAPNAVNLMEF